MEERKKSGEREREREREDSVIVRVRMLRMLSASIGKRGSTLMVFLRSGVMPKSGGGGEEGDGDFAKTGLESEACCTEG